MQNNVNLQFKKNKFLFGKAGEDFSIFRGKNSLKGVICTREENVLLFDASENYIWHFGFGSNESSR